MVVGRFVQKTLLFVSPCFNILWQVKELLQEVLRLHWISWNLVLRAHWEKSWIHIFTWDWAGLNLCLLYGEIKCSISILCLRRNTLFSMLPVRGRCALGMPKIAEKRDTICAPARTVGARWEALNLCRAVWPLVKGMKMGDAGTYRISEKENCSGT